MESKQLPIVRAIEGVIEFEISPRLKESGMDTSVDKKESLKEITDSQTQKKAENISQPSLHPKSEILETESEEVYSDFNLMQLDLALSEEDDCSLVIMDGIVYNKILESQEKFGILSPVIPDENVSSNKVEKSDKPDLPVSNETDLESKLESLEISNRTEKALEMAKNLLLKSNLKNSVKSDSQNAPSIFKTKLSQDVSRSVRNQHKRTESLRKTPEKPTRNKKTQQKNPVITQKDKLPSKINQNKGTASQATDIPSERKRSSSTQTSATMGCLAEISSPVVPDITTLRNEADLTENSRPQSICDSILENALNSLRTLSLESANKTYSGNNVGVSCSSSVVVKEGTSLNTVVESKINKHTETSLGNVSIQENETLCEPPRASATKTRQEVKTTPSTILKKDIECKATFQIPGYTTSDETVSENMASEFQLNTSQQAGDGPVDEIASKSRDSEFLIKTLEENKCFQILRANCLSYLADLSISIPAESLEWRKLYQETNREDKDKEISQPFMDKLSLDAKSKENKSESYEKEPDTKNRNKSTKASFSHVRDYLFDSDVKLLNSRNIFGQDRFPTLGDYESWWNFPDCDKTIPCDFDYFLAFYIEQNPFGFESLKKETPERNDENYMSRNESHLDSKMKVTKRAELTPSRIPKRQSMTKSEINPNLSPVRQPLEKRTDITPSRIPVRQTPKKETVETPVRKTPNKRTETSPSRTPVRKTPNKRTETSPSHTPVRKTPKERMETNRSKTAITPKKGTETNPGLIPARLKDKVKRNQSK